MTINSSVESYRLSIEPLSLDRLSKMEQEAEARGRGWQAGLIREVMEVKRRAAAEEAAQGLTLTGGS